MVGLGIHFGFFFPNFYSLNMYYIFNKKKKS